MKPELFAAVMVCSLLLTMLLTWAAFVFEYRLGKRIGTLFLLSIFAIITYASSGLNAAVLTFVSLSLIPVAVPLIFYPVARLVLRQTEAIHGPSGIKIDFDIFAGYKTIWS